MGDAKDQREGAVRRRSLLPQRSSARQSSMRMEALPEQQIPRNEGLATSIAKVGPVSVGIASNRNASMPPPASLGRPRSIRKPVEIPSLRRPSIRRPPLQDPFKTPAQPRTSSAGQDAQSGIKVSYHGRSVSQQVGSTSIPEASSSRLRLSRQSSMNSQKPAFTAMQRQFTPKKTKSRPPSPSLQAASQGEIPSADCLHLQMELAQLHLLHRSAHSVQTQWEQSAEQVFQRRFNALRDRHIELKEIAHQQQALINQLALVQWSQGKSGTQIAEKVQLLSRNITDVCSLVGSEGKYTRILEIFESWFRQALQIRDLRNIESRKGEATLDFVEGIGDGWKAEAMVLERELTYCSRELKAFGSVRPDSSLGRVRSLYTKLIVNLIDEVDVIQWIENQITIQEASWVESTIQALASGVNNDMRSVAVPRVVGQ